MLERLRIQNFKAWRDTGQLELAPLTILFGPNSSGKSSINHLLMMLKQTVRSSDRNSVFDLGDDDTPLNLGSFRDLIFGHNLENTLEFEQEWLLDAPMTVRDPRTRDQFIGDRLVFSAAARQTARSRVAQSEGFVYALANEEGTQLEVKLRRDPNRPARWKLDSAGYKLVSVQGMRARRGASSKGVSRAGPAFCRIDCV